jgi:hypothetical protein
VLAADDARDLGGKASEHHAVRIDDEPPLLDVAGRGGKRFHWSDELMWVQRLTGA